MSEEKPKYVRKKCEHNKYKFQCKDCKGSQICEHNNIKSICKGSSIYEQHKTDKSIEVIQLFYDEYV